MTISLNSDQEIREAVRLLLQSTTSDARKVEIMDAVHALGQTAVPHLRVLVEGARTRPLDMQRDVLVLVERFARDPLDLNVLVKPVASYLNTVDTRMREIVTEFLVKMGEHAKPAEDFALGCLRNTNRQIVLCGLRILDAIGSQCSTSIIVRIQAVQKAFAEDQEILPLLASIQDALAGRRTSQRRKAVPAVTGALPELPDKCFAGFSCLVVEDVGPVRQLLAAMLCRFGMKVIGAGDGESAMAILRDRKGTADMPSLMLLDMRLPGANGIQVLECLRNELESDLPVIALSAIMSRDIILRAGQLGVKNYLVKPVSVERALRSVQDVLLTIGSSRT